MQIKTSQKGRYSDEKCKADPQQVTIHNPGLSMGSAGVVVTEGNHGGMSGLATASGHANIASLHETPMIDGQPWRFLGHLLLGLVIAVVRNLGS